MIHTLRPSIWRRAPKRKLLAFGISVALLLHAFVLTVGAFSAAQEEKKIVRARVLVGHVEGEDFACDGFANARVRIAR